MLVGQKEYNVAAAFYDTSAAKETKHIKTLKERLEKEHQKLNDYVKKNDCKNFKAKLITCPKCESKINKNTFCEICVLYANMICVRKQL